MKSAKNQQRRKAHYFGPESLRTYSGSRTQPGEKGQPAGKKLARKAGRNALDSKRVGVVSKAYEQISKDRRRA